MGRLSPALRKGAFEESKVPRMMWRRVSFACPRVLPEICSGPAISNETTRITNRFVIEFGNRLPTVAKPSGTCQLFDRRGSKPRLAARLISHWSEEGQHNQARTTNHISRFLHTPSGKGSRTSEQYRPSATHGVASDVADNKRPVATTNRRSGGFVVTHRTVFQTFTLPGPKGNRLHKRLASSCLACRHSVRHLRFVRHAQVIRQCWAPHLGCHEPPLNLQGE